MRVRMFKPKTLAYAYCLTNLQEVTLNAVKKKKRTGFNGGIFFRYNNGNNVNAQKSWLPVPNTPVTTKPNTPLGGSGRRLSQKEYAQKKAQNLCFYYDQKYVPGHKCSGQLYFLTVLPEEEMETEEFLDVDKSHVDLDSSDLPAPQISLNALTCTNNFKTMRVIGTMGKHVLHILVDCGSTHNFLNKGMAKRLGCNIRTTCPLAVTVAGRNHLVSDSECKDFKWHFGNTLFTTDIMLLPLGGCDMVLGIQWLATLGDIKCNFKELRMEFKYNGKGVALKGTQKTNVEWMVTKATDKALKQMAQAEFNYMALCMIPQGDVFCMQMEGSTIVIDPKIQEVLAIHEDVFDVPTALLPPREHDHRIPLTEGAVPVNIRPYKHPSAQKDAIESMVKELLDAGVIKKSHSPFSLPIVMVKKKDNS
ncbi:RNA-directed DNA polymerase like protein [Tanacetum coccineum]